MLAVLAAAVVVSEGLVQVEIHSHHSNRHSAVHTQKTTTIGQRMMMVDSKHCFADTDRCTLLKKFLMTLGSKALGQSERKLGAVEVCSFPECPNKSF